MKKYFIGITVLGTAFLLQACSSDAVVTDGSRVSTQSENGQAVPTTNAVGTKQPTASAGLFDWPVDTARLSRGFLPNGTKRKKKPHLGVDLASTKDTPIYAAQDGVVIYTGKDFHGYGRMIMIEGKSGFATLYAHLDKAQVVNGDQVKKGQQIALMGRTGHATGVHLHFEIRKNLGPVDPLLYLPMPDSKTVNIRAPAGTFTSRVVEPSADADTSGDSE